MSGRFPGPLKGSRTHGDECVCVPSGMQTMMNIQYLCLHHQQNH